MKKKKTITERSNPRSINIDEMNSLEIVSLMNDEDSEIIRGVKRVLPQIAQAVDVIVERWKDGGRVFIVGAGTSGRLGVLDAVELIPTFSIEKDRWIGIIAGGYEAMWAPLEENEDDGEISIKELKRYSLTSRDVIIGISASGSTPYVLSALNYGKEHRAASISISSNDEAEISKISDISIEVIVGPEVIRGSTRLKSGTAQKMILNMISTATMVRLGKVYKNQMVEMKIINQKLEDRAVSILQDLANILENEAEILLKRSDYDLKTAIFIGITKASLEEANFYLDQADGRLKEAISRFFNTNN